MAGHSLTFVPLQQLRIWYTRNNLYTALSFAKHGVFVRSVHQLHCCKSGGASQAASKKTVIQVLRERGLLDQTTGPEVEKLCQKPVRIYVGFDPTAESLHIGNLLGIVILRWFQAHGHQPVVLLGGATGKIGDPSGKSAERPLLDDETIAKNLQGIKRNFEQILVFSHDSFNPVEPIILNNDDWLGKMGFLEFLRDVGKYTRVGTMLGKESVRNRMNNEEGISFTEFSYQLLQAYDFVHLHKHYGVDLQAGGSDQWGNIVAGKDLARRLLGANLHGLTFPLLTSSDGRKFGKSEKGAIWLSPEKLSPFEFYQFLYQTSDADVIRLLKYLTFLPLSEIGELELSMKNSSFYKPNTAQKLLAEEVTRLVHGDEGVKFAQRVTSASSPGRLVEESILDFDTLRQLKDEIPSKEIRKEHLLKKSLIEVLVECGIMKSKSEAKRFIINGGCYINNRRVEELDRSIGQEDLVENSMLLLGIGKKQKILLVAVE
ncbi:Tyrosine--tRNA ligase [Galdieria sulphuraria]|nr:Tyrosine--tRNA ligase [Galdieria sulphuraria]